MVLEVVVGGVVRTWFCRVSQGFAMLCTGALRLLGLRDLGCQV